MEKWKKENLLSCLHFTRSEKKEILEFLTEEEEEKFWADEQIKKILTDSRLSSQEKGKLFYRRAREIKYPRLTKLEKSWQKKVTEITAAFPQNLSFKTDPVFEKEEIEITLKISHPAQLKRVLQYLQTKEKEIEEIFSLIQGQSF